MKKNSICIETLNDQIGERIDRLLGSVPEIGSRSRATDLIDKHLVMVNGKTVKPSYKVSQGDSILVHLPEETPKGEILPLKMNLEILFEDEFLLVLNKPPGLVVHPAAGHAQDTLVNALIGHSNDFLMKFNESRPGIVHRLDKDTSGLMVVAKNDLVLEALSLQFKNRTINRWYLAVVYPNTLPQEGIIQSYLARHPIDRKKYASLRNSKKQIIRTKDDNLSTGKWAVTRYKILKRHTSGLTLVSLKLETGRTHQIRVHLSEIGASLIGDPIYGSNKSLNGIVGSEPREWVKTWPRLALHAEILGFTHPVTNEHLEFKTDWPSDLMPLIQHLGFTQYSGV